MPERYPAMSDEAEDSQVVGEFVRYYDYAKLEEALRAVLGYLGQDEYEMAIKKAHEVLGEGEKKA